MTDRKFKVDDVVVLLKVGAGGFDQWVGDVGVVKHVADDYDWDYPYRVRFSRVETGFAESELAMYDAATAASTAEGATLKRIETKLDRLLLRLHGELYDEEADRFIRV